MSKKINLVLHAHIPYVLETEVEYWLHEVVLHSYLPFLKMLESHKDNNICISVNLSPILLVQLSSKYFKDKFLKYLDMRKKILSTNLNDDDKNLILKKDLQKVLELEIFYKNWDSDIIKIFQHYSKTGVLNILTSAITHAFLPSLVSFPHVLDLQIKLGKQISELFFTDIKGFWSPECAVFPELSQHLSQYGLKYVFADPTASSTHSDFSHHDVNYICRDYLCTAKIWDAFIGYPGNVVYREFHKDLKDENREIQIILGENRIPLSGVSIYAITDKRTLVKSLYEHDKVKAQLQLDAKDFIKTLNETHKTKDSVSIFFDMELFGHWWKEGVDFLDTLIEQLQDTNIQITDDFLDIPLPEQEPLISTWGTNYNAESWINPKTTKVWSKLIPSLYELEMLLKHDQEISKDKIYYTLLAQASDWTFLITKDTFKEYSERLIIESLKNSNKDILTNKKEVSNILYQII